MPKAPEVIKRLTDDFNRNIESFKEAGYNETQLRREFIDPFFEALGWDIANKAGIAPAYRDVIHEDAIKIGGTTKAPDYCFRIGATRKFFLEAKKPAINIKGDISPAYQLRRYAWSAKLPLSILTDFEELAVYDCQIRPNVNDKATTARMFYCNYKDYAEKWEQIAGVFSKEAVLKGAFDKYASEKTTKRGTTTVDKEILAEIEGWRETLAKNIALRNSKLSVYDLNFAVQKTIDRILFLRICEDRGIERAENLLGLVNGGRIYPRLFELFEKADERYNSGIFHFRREKERPEGPDELSANLKIDDDVLKQILKDLYYPHSPYEFSVMPAEILGNVYEQFLGKVIRLTASHQAKVEEKPEVKKAGGVYYTPSYIVDYIVKNTVGKLCEGKTPKQIEKIKILDPACGSGSFLIGAYQYLLDWHRDWYVGEDTMRLPRCARNDASSSRRRLNKSVYQGKGGQWFLTIEEKKRILLNNIFGVDIDSQATEVTKLSLLLKVLENETQESLRLFHERALPDLGDNIKCGNSLIGPDFYQNQQMTFGFDEEQQRKINAFDWQKEFAPIFKQGGFDAVIGNPPYIQLSMSAYYDEDVNQYLSHNYSSSMGRLNTYGFFIEKALRILVGKDGLLSFIVPNTILTQEYYQSLRQQILQYQLNNITTYNFPVFQRAVVETTVFVIKKHSQNKNVVNIVECDNKSMSYQMRKIQQKTFLKSHNNAFLVKVDLRDLAFKEKLDKVGLQLGNICNLNQAIALKYDRSKSLFKKNAGSNYKRVLDGRNIQRYTLEWDGTYLAYNTKNIHSCKRTDIFEADGKILFRRVGSSLIATYDDAKFYALNTLVVITPFVQTKDSLKYILGILNSRLMNYYYVKHLKSTKKIFSEIQARQISQIPICVIDFSRPDEVKKHDKMVSLVEEMLELHKKINTIKNPNEKTRVQRQIDSTDERIDQLVYELYGLTDEEIGIVKGK
ncbi:MAG: TaqI-like C-terminal specificity domain-containing protein [Phycisphaerae bacterium]|jgi:type I restriction-modification system DNA methylase subunit